MIAPKDQWLDRDAGPVVRPYAVTRGRTGPAAGTSLGMIDVVVAAGEQVTCGLLAIALNAAGVKARSRTRPRSGAVLPPIPLS